MDVEPGTLIHAIEGHNMHHFEELLASGANLDERDDTHKTPYMHACATNQLEMVKMLEAAGADVNAADDQGITALHISLGTNHPRIVHHLIQNPSVNVNTATTDGATPLHLASLIGDAATVEVLIRRGADVNTIDENSCTPLIDAVAEGHLAVARLLILAGADAYIQDSHGMSAMDWAVEGHHTSITNLLEKAGEADPTERHNASLNFAADPVISSRSKSQSKKQPHGHRKHKKHIRRQRATRHKFHASENDPSPVNMNDPVKPMPFAHRRNRTHRNRVNNPRPL